MENRLETLVGLAVLAVGAAAAAVNGPQGWWSRAFWVIAVVAAAVALFVLLWPLILWFLKFTYHSAMKAEEERLKKAKILAELSSLLDESRPTRWAVRLANHVDKIKEERSKGKKPWSKGMKFSTDLAVLEIPADKFILEWEGRVKDALRKYLNDDYMVRFENPTDVPPDQRCDAWQFSAERREQWAQVHRGMQQLHEFIKEVQE